MNPNILADLLEALSDNTKQHADNIADAVSDSRYVAGYRDGISITLTFLLVEINKMTLAAMA